jgi:hypothetical protein
MKRFILPILLFFSILRAVANPLPSPWIEISELQFRADGSWILEIAVSPVNGYPIEAIWIKSNSGESKLKHFEDDGSYKLLVVENDDLTTPLTINPIQDNVNVGLGTEEVGGEYFVTLTYGYPSSKGYSNVRTPKTGQSIAAIGALYSITKSPTIGFANDTTGMMGTIKGVIYDKNGLPLPNMSDRGLIFDRDGYFFYTQSDDGSYSTRYYSRDNEEVWRLRYRYENVYRSVDITPINFSMQPDSVVIRDIYLTGDIYVGINEINSNMESVLKIYPQPVKQQSLNYEISIPVKSSETYLIFRNMDGQEIYRFSVTENKGVITLPENIKNGSYIVQLISNRKNYATAKIIVQ